MLRITSLILLIASALGATGCPHSEPRPRNPDGTVMSHEQMLRRGDELIAQGRAMRSNGVALAEGGNAERGERAMMRGDELILQGQKLKDQGLMTP